MRCNQPAICGTCFRHARVALAAEGEHYIAVDQAEALVAGHLLLGEPRPFLRRRGAAHPSR
ncbi:MAG TPA: hypothetical protein VFZ10_22780, partial [Geminicoccaceae bacterium]